MGRNNLKNTPNFKEKSFKKILILLCVSGFVFPQSADAYCLDLHIGANLVSFYRLPENSSIDYVFSESDELITGIIGEGVAASYISGTGWVGSLEYIKAEDGYWLESSYPINLCIPNAVPTGTELRYTLHEGSNLISYPSRASLPLEAALPEGIEDNISGIIGEGVAAQYIVNIGWMGSLTHFEGNKGYWIRTNETITFSINTH